MLSQEAKQRLQLALALAIVVAAVRAGYVIYERHEENVAAKKEQAANGAGYANADYYVSPKKLYPYDLKSASDIECFVTRMTIRETKSPIDAVV